MTQQNARGCYLNFEHDRAQDWDFLAKWQPNVIRYMGQGKIDDPASFDVNRVKRIHDTCPDATVLLRCWEVDDNNFEAHDAMVADPRATAERQVDWWAKVFDRAGAAGIPRERLMAGLNNETGPEKDQALWYYTRQALHVATPKAVRLGVFVFSVGRPSLPGEAQYTIDDFSELDSAILANNGAVLLHEYLQPEGMYCVWTDEDGNERKDYTYLIGRHARWNIKSPIIIGEWGIDGILYNRHADPEYGNSGWRNFPQDWTPQRYADEYVECVQKSSANVIGICPFLSDFSDQKWKSFDVLDAYGALLARKDRCVKEIDAPSTIHIPTVGTGASTTPYIPKANEALDPMLSGTVTANVLNVRSGPSTDYPIVDKRGYGDRLTLSAQKDDWYEIGNGKWVYGEFVQRRDASDAPEQPTPAPQPVVSGIIDPLTALAFLQVESGNRAFTDGLLTIRFEVHRFKANLKNDALFDKHFKFTPGKYAEQYWRPTPDGEWLNAHGSMADRHKLLTFAMSLDTNAALKSAGMGMAQVMGENHKRIGYSTPLAMFIAFGHGKYGANAQLMGFVDYVLSDPELFEALRNQDWREAVTRYNGTGQEDIYIPALEKALAQISQEIGA